MAPVIGGIAGTLIGGPVGGIIGSAGGSGLVSLFGGGSSKSSPQPASTATSSQPQGAQVYTPQNQPWADINYTNLIGSLIGPYQAGTTPAQELSPRGVDQAVNYQAIANVFQPLAEDVTNNPYQWQSLAGTQGAATIGQTTSAAQNQIYNQLLQYLPGLQQQLAGQVTANVPQINQLGSATAGYAPTAANLAGGTAGLSPQLQAIVDQVTGNIAPTTGLAQQIAGTLPSYQAGAQNIAGLGPQAARQTGMFGALEAQPTGAPLLQQAAGGLLQSGFDPQGALYNQLQQQTLDQARAINAMSGVGTSPYGAGVTDDALRNFNIQWQNQQLGRQLQAAQGAGSALAGAQGLNLGQAQLGQDVLGGLGTQAGLTQQALNALTSMGGQAGAAGGLYGQGANIGQTAGGLVSGLGGLNTAAVNQLAAAGGLNTRAVDQLLAGGQLDATGAGLLGQIPQTAYNAGQVGSQAANQLATTQALSSQTYLQQLQANINARNQQLQAAGGVLPQFTSAANLGTIPQNEALNILSPLANYLRLGQGASELGGTLGQMGVAQAQQGLQGLLSTGGLVSQGLFGSQGLAGALGLDSGGLLGGGTPGSFGGNAVGAGSEQILGTDPGFFGSLFGGGAGGDWFSG